MINNCLLTRGNLALIPLDMNQTAQEIREKDMGYFEGAVTSKTLKDVLGFDNYSSIIFYSSRLCLNRRQLNKRHNH